MVWTVTNSHGLKQSIWLRTNHSGSCSHLMALLVEVVEIVEMLDD